MTLSEAVARYVKPGMKLHIAGGIGGAGAGIREIIRQFKGTNPGFTLIQSTVTGHAINLLAANLLKKMIFSACMDLSPSGRPSKIMQQKWADKSVEFEDWSLCTLQQRLFAGALGVPFLPTRSLAGSQMAVDNQHAFKEIADPFNKDAKAGVLEALNPDISIVHACVADSLGNAILQIPYGDEVWGSLASKGVIVTVEKIVPTDVIRKHSPLVKIPGHLVKAVCVAPFGVHPFSLANPGLEDFQGYESDVDFLTELHQAFAGPGPLEKWIKDWIIDCPTSEDYIKKLGPARIQSLMQIKALAQVKAPTEKPSKATATSDSAYTGEELMLIAASREIINSIIKNDLKVVLLGAGSRSVSVLLAFHKLKAQGYDLEIITGNGQYGYDPLPGEVGLQNLAGVYSSKMVMDTITSQGIVIGGKNNSCLGVLGAGQIDKYGNTNSTLTSSGQFLVGSGGANDVGNAKEVMVVLNQAKDKFVDKLPYITCPGTRMTTVISTMGIYKKEYGKNELKLTACFPDSKGTGLKERIQQIQDQCAWPLLTADRVEDVPPPSADELSLLRHLVTG
jgi:acyl CoA:acetate/3-ketoacid CoA transferase alpha subunit/acyl CoA:acetate/3-ketoacid CoA transferase beta subunit